MPGIGALAAHPAARPGRAERATHNYFRHGTVSLFATLDVSVPAGLDLHLVLDNYAAHKAPTVRRWLARHPRFHLRFIPTHSSWLNQVERWFAKITNEAIRRGSFRSVPHLRLTILDYIAANNRRPKPFVWTASADLILGKVAHLCGELA